MLSSLAVLEPSASCWKEAYYTGHERSQFPCLLRDNLIYPGDNGAVSARLDDGPRELQVVQVLAQGFLQFDLVCQGQCEAPYPTSHFPEVLRFGHRW